MLLLNPFHLINWYFLHICKCTWDPFRLQPLFEIPVLCGDVRVSVCRTVFMWTPNDIGVAMKIVEQTQIIYIFTPSEFSITVVEFSVSF